MNFDFSIISDFKYQAVLFYVGDSSIDAARSDNFVTSAESLYHLSVLFLFFTLRSDEEEPHACNYEYVKSYSVHRALCESCVS